MKAYEKIVKGENIPEPGVPESFKVLLKELQSIGLDVKILNEDQEEVIMKELEDEDEVVETGIEEVMEGSAVETDEVTVVEPEVEEEMCIRDRAYGSLAAKTLCNNHCYKICVGFAWLAIPS